jgi:hypothetical protein
MGNISCEHGNYVKCIRISIGDEGNASAKIGEIKLCQNCWSNFVSTVNAASVGEAKDVKYVDDAKVAPRVYVVEDHLPDEEVMSD